MAQYYAVADERVKYPSGIHGAQRWTMSLCRSILELIMNQ